MSLLKVTGLGKSFGGVKAVDGIHFELAAGELLALIGPNGAGKSTTFNWSTASCLPMPAPSCWAARSWWAASRATSGAWVWAAPSRSPKPLHR